MRGPRGGDLGCTGRAAADLGCAGRAAADLACAGRAAADLGCAGRAAADLGCARRAASDARAGVFRLGDYREFDDVTWNDRGSLTMGCFTIGISSEQNGVKSRKYKGTLISSGYQ